MIRLLVTIALIIFSSALNGQSDSDYLDYKRSFFGYDFYQEDRKVNKKEVHELLEIDENAIKLFNNAMTKTNMSSILGFAGGFMLGWNIGDYLINGTFSGSMTAAGLGLTLLSLGLESKAHSELREALNIYNDGYSYVPTNGHSTKLVLCGNSIRLLYVF